MTAVARAIDRRHIDLRAQRRFHHRHRHGDMHIVTHAMKQLVRPYLDDQVKIARWRTFCARVALARQANPLPIARPRLDAKFQRLTPRHDARAIACLATVLHLACTAAARALDVELHPPAHLRHLPGPVAFRAFDAAAYHRAPFAGRALLLPLDFKLRHTAADRCPEIHLHLVLEICPRLWPARLSPATAAAAEHAAKNVLEASAETPTLLRRRVAPGISPTRKARKVKAFEIERRSTLPRPGARASAAKTRATRRPAATRIGLGRGRVDVVRVEPNLVIDLALLVLAQDVVRFGDFLELLLRLLVPGIYVRVIFTRKFAKRLANLIAGRRLLHAKRAVIVFRLLCHEYLA